MKKLHTIASLAAAGAIIATPFFALADTNADAEVNASGETQMGVPGLTGKIQSALHVKANAGRQHDQEAHASSTMAHLDTRGENEIDSRIQSLMKLEGRVNGFARLTADQKTAFMNAITAEINTLTQLKTQIAADTSTTTLKADVESVTKNQRVYALVMPQISIAASADRVLAVAAQMDALAPKLQARITAAAAAGMNVSAAQTAYADMTAKVADAKVQAQAATSLTANLKPDNGDKTLFASNAQALKDARAKLKLAEADLRTARKDVNTILKAVKGMRAEGHAEGTATTTASTTGTH